MSDEKIVNFPGTNGPETTDAAPKREVTADDVLTAALGQFDEVVLIGIGPNRSQCISTVPLQLAVFELTRAIHRIHERSDNM